MKLDVFELPTHWACALMYGDDSGLDESDIAAIERFTAHETRDGKSLHLLEVKDNHGGDFRRYHDATRYGVLACDVSEFVFDRD